MSVKSELAGDGSRFRLRVGILCIALFDWAEIQSVMRSDPLTTAKTRLALETANLSYYRVFDRVLVFLAPPPWQSCVSLLFVAPTVARLVQC